MKCEERLYQTVDRKKLVREGDPKAAFLYATPGDEIPESAADSYGLVAGGLPRKVDKVDGEPAAKPKPAASDKEKPASETKA